MSAEPEAFPPSPGGSAFPSTHWSMIVRAADPGASVTLSALEDLCRQYWFPLYAFVRRQGRAHHEAEDCTQEFLARLLASDGIGRARQAEGRFRTFLLASLRNFLTKEWNRSQAAKRGGGALHLALDFQAAEENFSHELADTALTPEQAYDRSWALGLIEHSIGELRKEYEKSGRGALFTALTLLVWTSAADESYAIPAARLGLTTNAFKVALHRLRQRLAQRLRADVAETVADDHEVDAELRHLIAAFSARSPGR